MSEEVKEVKEGKKKKGKLPVILVLLLVLGGGGFFVMKSKGGSKKVEIKAGETAPIEKEFLVNLNNGGGNIYLRAELAVELREGYKKEDLDANMPAIRDCINQIFRSKSLQQVGASQTAVLRKEIAVAINAILVSHMKEEEKKAQGDFEKAAAEKPEPAKKGEEAKEKKEPSEKDEWVTPAGPVLNVYFSSFTTQ